MQFKRIQIKKKEKKLTNLTRDSHKTMITL
jgi:hypothetical protein